MPDTPPTVIVLKDLDSITAEFVCARPFKFELREYPGKQYEVMIKPLTEALLARAREFTQISPPKIKVERKKEGSEQIELVDEDNFGDPEFLRQINEKSALRRAFVLQHGLPEIKFAGDNPEAIAKEIAEKFPEPYSIAIEKEILARSTNELAIINLANFSASAGSALS
jgi:hypothetical protein